MNKRLSFSQPMLLRRMRSRCKATLLREAMGIGHMAKMDVTGKTLPCFLLRSCLLSPMRLQYIGKGRPVQTAQTHPIALWHHLIGRNGIRRSSFAKLQYNFFPNVPLFLSSRDTTRPPPQPRLKKSVALLQIKRNRDRAD